MSPFFISLGILAAGIVSIVTLDLFGRRSSPLDTEREERWFIAHAPAPLRRVLRHAERRTAGAAAVILMFGIALISATLVGWILDTTDENTGFARWDQSAAEWGAEHGTDTSTNVLEIITQLGATGWLLIVMVVVGGVEAYRHRKIAIIGYLAVIGLGISALNNLLKHLVARERPSVRPLTESSSFAFPSGHAAAAAACWAALALVAARHWGRRGRAAASLIAMLITVAVAASRVLLGVHWLTDVIAGATVGWAWFFVITLIFGGRILRFGEPAERIANTPPSTDEVALGEPSSADTSHAGSSRNSAASTHATEYQR
ncbi:MAG TPA: phosphatase PAP2 family protein [Ilumatobacter sp.]|nr:phosphatase PAP2 family protein [Ilumatobacter sp.]